MRESAKEYSALKATLLKEGPFHARYEVNRQYVASLKNENLLQNHLLEAGLKSWSNKPGDDIHWGWESPECQLRGHFPGHWLSAAARMVAQTGDPELKGKAEDIIDRLAVCQQENGGQWAGSIPEKYLHCIARGKKIWAPHYTVHKTLMGLADMAKFAGNAKALEIADHWADWFLNWTDGFGRDQMDDILDFETGGMLEVWADLYGLTGLGKYATLMHRYDRPRLFDRLLAGEDPLTDMHANTTIPEIHGAARAYETTGDERYRKIAEAYWEMAVTQRGYFATGGQTNGEVWTPRQNLAGRLSPTNQEHCVVYNMIRLADFLFRWSGKAEYLDYIERNIHNGLFAQQNIRDGMVAYYLPLHAGSVKKWGTPTGNFWCCHGTMVQAHTLYADLAFYASGTSLVIAQFIPSEARHAVDGGIVTTTLHASFDKAGANEAVIDVKADRPAAFSLDIRIPWWVQEYTLRINGETRRMQRDDSGFLKLERTWLDDRVGLVFPKAVRACPLPGEPHTVAFMHGPVVLAGLCDEEREIRLGGKTVSELFRPFDENGWGDVSFYLTGQPAGMKFVPIHSISSEKYTVYFPVIVV